MESAHGAGVYGVWAVEEERGKDHRKGQRTAGTRRSAAVGGGTGEAECDIARLEAVLQPGLRQRGVSSRGRTRGRAGASLSEKAAQGVLAGHAPVLSGAGVWRARSGSSADAGLCGFVSL